jgi:hypothetical protein
MEKGRVLVRTPHAPLLNVYIIPKYREVEKKFAIVTQDLGSD